jgi:hypothetical protein
VIRPAPLRGSSVWQAKSACDAVLATFKPSREALEQLNPGVGATALQCPDGTAEPTTVCINLMPFASAIVRNPGRAGWCPFNPGVQDGAAVIVAWPCTWPQCAGHDASGRLSKNHRLAALSAWTEACLPDEPNQRWTYHPRSRQPSIFLNKLPTQPLPPRVLPPPPPFPWQTPLPLALRPWPRRPRPRRP